jgi:hypothetical protein
MSQLFPFRHGSFLAFGCSILDQLPPQCTRAAAPLVALTAVLLRNSSMVRPRVQRQRRPNDNKILLESD